MLWRACDQPSTNVLPNCQEASQRQQLLLSRHLSPSSITLIKCSSSHSVSDKARQWLDQSPIKKKRSWPCTTWRCTGRHCASKSCNWERPSRPPLSKRMTFDLVKSNLPLWKRVIFSKEKGWIFRKIPWSFLAPQFWCARVSIFLQSDIFQMIEYNQINNSLKIHQSTKTAIHATELVVFSPKLSSKYYTFGDQKPLQNCHQKCLKRDGPAETLDDRGERTSTKSFQVKKLNITTMFCCLFQSMYWKWWNAWTSKVPRG